MRPCRICGQAITDPGRRGKRRLCDACIPVDRASRKTAFYAAKYPDETAGTKRCSTCEDLLPLHAFPKNPRGRYGVSSLCESCHLASGKRWKEQNKEKSTEYHKQYYKNNKIAIHLKYKYGLTPSQRDTLFESQGLMCPGCHKGFTSEDDTSAWHIDHNHDTSQVRGILCRADNLVLGLVKDSPPRLRALADYLETTDDTLGRTCPAGMFSAW